MKTTVEKVLFQFFPMLLAFPPVPTTCKTSPSLWAGIIRQLCLYLHRQSLVLILVVWLTMRAFCIVSLAVVFVSITSLVQKPGLSQLKCSLDLSQKNRDVLSLEEGYGCQADHPLSVILLNPLHTLCYKTENIFGLHVDSE